MKITGSVHNGKVATLLNQDCWIGCILIDGRFSCRAADLSPECDTREEALKWVRDQLTLRNAYPTTIEIRDGGCAGEYTYRNA